MDPITAAYQTIECRLTAWVSAQPDIRAALVFGSRARTGHVADPWSDLDVLLVCTDPAPYWHDDAWLAHMGEVWFSFTEPTPDGGFERRALYAGGLDVDFAPDPVSSYERMLTDGVSAFGAGLIRRGARVLVDKDGLLARLIALVPCDAPPWQAPDAAEYANTVHDFWFHAVWTAKRLCRGEMWRAKHCCDIYLKSLLLRVVEWHAHATHDDELDTWMAGRFLREWADPRVVAALPAIYAHYTRPDIARALGETMRLFAWVAAETAVVLGYVYPLEAERRATGCVAQLLAGEWPSNPMRDKTG